MTAVTGRGSDRMGFDQAADEAQAAKQLKIQRKQQTKAAKAAEKKRKAVAKAHRQAGETLFEVAQLVRKNLQSEPQAAFTPTPPRP